MQAAAGGANQLGQPPLNVHVQVFEGRIPGEIAGFNFGLDGLQSGDDGVRVRRRNNALAGQHPGVSHRTGNILPIQAAIVMNGYGVAAVVGHGRMIGSRWDGQVGISIAWLGMG